MARLIEPVMSQSLGQKIIVDNRPGANQSIGAGFVAHSPPDGSTMLISTSGPVTNALSAPVSYDPATAFQPISRVMTSPFFLVVPEKSKLKTVADLIAAGKDPSQVIRYGHPGPGTATHLATALLNKAAGTNFVGIPYRGSAGQVQDTISGELQFGLLAAPDALSRRNEGLRILGVSGATRSVLAPDIPTIAEQGVPGIRCCALAWSVCACADPSSGRRTAAGGLGVGAKGRGQPCALPGARDGAGPRHSRGVFRHRQNSAGKGLCASQGTRFEDAVKQSHCGGRMAVLRSIAGRRT